jgi:surfeit locus 1 family protein
MLMHSKRNKKFFWQGYAFKPKWSMVIITLIFLAILLYLGFWQLQRAQEKRDLQAIYNGRMHSIPLQLSQLNKPLEVLRYYPVQLTGYYDNAHTILLDNKVNNHRIGYEVLTPFILPNSQNAILVNRGWISAGTNRAILPTIPAITSERTIDGIIYVALGKAFTLSDKLETPGSWPLRVQTVQLPELAKLLNKPLFPFTVLLAPNVSGGFVREWQPVVMPPYKHTGYAVQWFSLAALLIILFVFLNIQRRHPVNKTDNVVG